MLYLINIILSAYTLMVYALYFFGGTSHWLVGFMLMSIPIILIAHIAILIMGVLQLNRKSSSLSLLMLLFSIPLIQKTYQWNSSTVVDKEENHIRVASYNVRSYKEDSNVEKSLLSKEGKAWLINSDIDILVLQESLQSKKIHSTTSMKELGFKYFVLGTEEKFNEHSIHNGLAIYSKYPLKDIAFKRYSGVNGLLRATVNVDGTPITLITVHLHSMTLQLNELKKVRNWEEFKVEAKIRYNKIKRGFALRAEQADELATWIENAKSPVLLCGDFNEMPYGYTYSKMKALLANSFEEKGSGFGFTYNQFPYAIRIDNHFFDKEVFELINFQTDKSARFSDHDPIIGDYILIKKPTL